jgi:Domain of unknown function (DUF1841)
MDRYDPNVAPDPHIWLDLDEDERLDLVRRFHRKARLHAPNPQVHAVIHATVENQAALGDEMRVQRTLERLMAEGLDRHDAIHAVGSVLADFLFAAMRGEAAFDEAKYAAELDALTKESWFALAEDPSA